MIRRIRIFGILFLAGLAVRSIEFPKLFTSTGVHLPFAGDAYYHMRRIWYSVSRFPETLPFDRYVGFPEGAQIVWPSAFDWTIAALIRPFVDPTDQGSVEALAVWAPAVLGAATAGLVGLFAERFFGPRAGWLAGILYAVLPMSFVYSRMGMIDHHVGVALMTTVMLWLTCEMVVDVGRTRSNTARGSRKRISLALSLGLVSAATILTWPGALLHVGVLQIALGVWWLSAEDRITARRRLISFVLSQAVLACCIAPLSLGLQWTEYGTWSPLVLTRFQPVYFAAAASTALLVQLLHERTRMGETIVGRAGSAIAFAIVGVLLALVAIPPLRESMVNAMGWFSQGEEVLGLIYETQPILMVSGTFDPNFALLRFGPGFLLFPLVWLYFARQALNDSSAPRAVLLFWALAFQFLTLLQWRFGNTFGPAYSILVAAAVCEWGGSLRVRGATRSSRLALEIGITAALLVWTAFELMEFYRPKVAAIYKTLASEETRGRGPLIPSKRIFDEAGRWIARETPETNGYLDATIDPEYAVLADWTVGHLLRYRAQRPMVQDNFGPFAGRASFESASAYFRERDETAAIEILDRLGVRYVVGGESGTGSLADVPSDAMAYRLSLGFGSAYRQRRTGRVPGLQRHRLIFHAHSAPADQVGFNVHAPWPYSSLGVWEIVPGARIQGRADPGEVVRLNLSLETTSRATHRYRLRTVADPNGVYRFVVPYPTDHRFSSSVRVEGAYQIRSGERAASFLVREADISSAAEVSGPDLRRP